MKPATHRSPWAFPPPWPLLGLISCFFSILWVPDFSWRKAKCCLWGTRIGLGSSALAPSKENEADSHALGTLAALLLASFWPIWPLFADPASIGRSGLSWPIWPLLADLASFGRSGLFWPIWPLLAGLASFGRYGLFWPICSCLYLQWGNRRLSLL